ncbi:MAG: hypothetical protein NXI25_17390 [bacterium]|jgi:hypothetical protein|nr:hypothetical protein [bacterium]
MWNIIINWARKKTLEKPYWHWVVLEYFFFALLIGMLILLLLFMG